LCCVFAVHNVSSNVEKTMNMANVDEGSLWQAKPMNSCVPEGVGDSPVLALRAAEEVLSVAVDEAKSLLETAVAEGLKRAWVPPAIAKELSFAADMPPGLTKEVKIADGIPEVVADDPKCTPDVPVESMCDNVSG
jgi:hypothetical protein